ncbi:MAG: hypothetical protein WBI14_09515, partial [Anaerolineaceae bacterium]
MPQLYGTDRGACKRSPGHIMNLICDDAHSPGCIVLEFMIWAYCLIQGKAYIDARGRSWENLIDRKGWIYREWNQQEPSGGRIVP